MSVFKPKYRAKTGEPVQSKTWWCEFSYLGKRYRESAKTTRKTFALEYEKRRRLDLERAFAGMPAQQSARERIQSVSEVIKPYLETFPVNHRPKSVVSAKGRLKHVARLLGSVALSNLTEQRILGYMSTRQDEGASGRTVNMEVQQLAQAIGRTWRVLWPRVRKLEENQDTGRALSPEEQGRLLEAIPRVQSPMLGTFIRLALLTGMRSDEMRTLQWSQCDLARRVVTVGRAKTSSGTGREIPMNDSLHAVLGAHASWYAARFGETRPAFYVFPWGSPQPSDPDRPTTSFKHAWGTLREAAGVACRLHDLRHAFCTRLAEDGTPESTMLSLMGHMSRAMLEKYSHIRMKAKRAAVEAITLPEIPVALPQETPKVNRKPAHRIM